MVTRRIDGEGRNEDKWGKKEEILRQTIIDKGRKERRDVMKKIKLRKTDRC